MSKLDRLRCSIARTALLVLASVAITLAVSPAFPATCGDGTREYPEQCDDGNVVSGDGCNDGCLDECPSLEGDWLARSDAPGSLDATWSIVEDVTGSLTVDTPSDLLTGTRTVGVRSTISLAATNEPFTFSGEMTTCDAIDLRIDQLPWRITLTRIVAPPTCDGALPLTRTTLNLSGLASAAGGQGLVASGRIVLPPGFSFDPATTGVQILIEDLGHGGAPVVDATSMATAIPGAAVGSCVGRGEGWRRTTYRNLMQAADPDSCRIATADALTLRLADRRPRASEATFSLRLRHAAIAPPVGPLRLTLALGTTAADLDAARCGNAQPVLACTSSRNGKQTRCR